MESSDEQNHTNQCTELRCITGDDEKKLYVVNVRELYISFARNFRRINSSCSTPKIIVDTFVSIVLKSTG